MELFRKDTTISEYIACFIGTILATLCILVFLFNGTWNNNAEQICGFALGLLFGFVFVVGSSNNELKREINRLKAKLYDNGESKC